MFRRSLEILPGQPAAACNLADLYDGLGNHEAAERVLVTAASERPDDPILAEALSARQMTARSE
jgi:Flp pilus assembly protein TadD